MCGIAGFIKRDDVETTKVIARQLELLAHRGPDSSGVVDKPMAVIGQTRLSVIDLVTGDPPITNEDGSVGVALNGEIYNYRALREELQRRGHDFATAGDTEVIAHLAEELTGPELAAALDGMFAIAVWDDRTQRLTIIRDRVGKKPLYYWSENGEFVFASEIKALLAHPRVPRRFATDVLSSYLTFGYVPTPETFFEGIQSLAPGHLLVVTDGRVEISKYWEPEVPGATSAARHDMSFDDAAREVRRLFENAVTKRLVTDVPLGAFLSGGIDSSAVVGATASLTGEPVRTFTIGFNDAHDFDERRYARQISQRFKTDHTEFVVDPDAVELVEQLVWNYDQPFGDSSAIPTYLLSQLTRRHVTVALSGDGGDEVFAGYERFAAALAVRRYERIPAPVRSLTTRGLLKLPQGSSRRRLAGVTRFLTAADRGLPDAYLSWVSFLDRAEREELLGRRDGVAAESYRGVWHQTDGADLLDRLLVLNMKTYLVDDLLPKIDRMSMAHGLEVRSPFLDHRLVEFALRLPASFRVRGFTLKRVLKAAVDDLLPPEIARRRKRGFGVPLDRWFRDDLHGYVDSMLGRNARVRSYLRGAALDRVLEQHRSGFRQHGQALWALLTLEVFLRREGW